MSKRAVASGLVIASWCVVPVWFGCLTLVTRVLMSPEDFRTDNAPYNVLLALMPLGSLVGAWCVAIVLASIGAVLIARDQEHRGASRRTRLALAVGSALFAFPLEVALLMKLIPPSSCALP